MHFFGRYFSPPPAAPVCLVLLFAVASCAEHKMLDKRGKLTYFPIPTAEKSCAGGVVSWSDKAECSADYAAMVNGLNVIVVDYTGAETGSIVVSCEEGAVRQWAGSCSKQ